MTTTTPTPTTPSSDRRSATRAKLLDAALDVFAEKGLHGASVDDLAAAAGFTKGALYSNFATKEELFGAVIDEQGHRMIAAVREVMTSQAHEIDENPALTPTDAADPVLAEVLTRINGIGHRWYLLESEFQLYGLRSPEGRDLYATALRALPRRARRPARGAAVAQGSSPHRAAGAAGRDRHRRLHEPAGPAAARHRPRGCGRPARGRAARACSSRSASRTAPAPHLLSLSGRGRTGGPPGRA